MSAITARREAAMTTKSRSERTDIPAELIEQARAVGPAVLEALLACYPTDEEHERNERRKRVRAQRQLTLPIAKVA